MIFLSSPPQVSHFSLTHTLSPPLSSTVPPSSPTSHSTSSPPRQIVTNDDSLRHRNHSRFGKTALLLTNAQDNNRSIPNSRISTSSSWLNSDLSTSQTAHHPKPRTFSHPKFPPRASPQLFYYLPPQPPTSTALITTDESDGTATNIIHTTRSDQSAQMANKSPVRTGQSY